MMDRSVLSYMEPAYENKCEDCSYFSGKDKCDLFRKLNTECSDLFDLQEKVMPSGGCKAFEGDEVKDMESLKKIKDKKIKEEDDD